MDISGNILLRLTFSAAPESTTTATFFHVHCAASAFSLDQMVHSQTPALFRRLLQGSGMVALIHSLSPSSDSVPFGPHRQVTPSSQVLLASLPQVHFPMMNRSHNFHQCCWSTYMDNSLRCALALRNRSNIGSRSYIYLFLCLCLCYKREREREREREKRKEKREKRKEKEKEKEKADILTSVSLEPMNMVTKLNRRSLKSQGKLGHHNVP